MRTSPLSSSQEPPLRPDQSGIAQNTFLNIAGLAVPLAVAFFVMPIAALHLGPARFGLLGLAWAFTEYLTLFDLGLGRATVKFVADGLHGDREDLSETASLATVAQLLAGALGGLLFFAAARPIVDLAFDLRSELVGEAVAMFQVVGLNLPLVLLMSALRAVLEGAQRFDLSNSIRTLGSSAAVIIPAIAAAFGASLPEILLWVLGSRLVVSFMYLIAIRHAVPGLAWRVPRHWSRLDKLFSFGGWVFVSNAVGPVLVYFDRFALAAIAGVAAVGFYTAPYEGVTRLVLIPVALMGSLFPALTVLEKNGDRARLKQVLSASGRMLAVVMIPPLAILVAFAPDLLEFWLGAIYAQQTATALRIIAVGVLMNALAHPLFISLYAMNRPDLPAKFHLVELLIHLPLTIVLIRSFGIAGAAGAWTVRVALDFFLLIIATSRITEMSIPAVAGGRFLRLAAAGLGLLAMLWWAATVGSSQMTLAVLVTIGSLAGFTALSWLWILHEAERTAFARVFARPFSGRSR